MTSVYAVDSTEDKFVTQLKSDLIASDNGNNTDMHISFQGYLHNKSGFKLKAENIEVFDGDLIETWKNIIESQGMTADITADLSNAWVQITCRRVRRHRKSIRERWKLPSIMKFPSVPLSLLFYIGILIACIIVLWQRHKEKFLS